MMRLAAYLLLVLMCSFVLSVPVFAHSWPGSAVYGMIQEDPAPAPEPEPCTPAPDKPCPEPEPEPEPEPKKS